MERYWNMIKHLLFIVFLAFVLQSCGTNYTALKSLEKNVSTYNGIDYIQKEDTINNYKIVCSYSHNNPHYYAMFVEIFNYSNDTLTLDPDKFRIKTGLINDSMFLAKTNDRALIPEAEIRRIMEENANLSNKTKNKQVALGILSLLNIGVMVARAASSDNESADLSSHIAIQSTLISEMVNAKHYEEIDRIQNLSEKEFWENEALRKTTLNPGEKVKGYVLFPISDSSSEIIKLIFPINKSNFEFLYQKISVPYQ